ncbi:MAG: methylmalonyl Co-A mutase-associated GTPase MeaB [Chitinophagaceae bacterium]|nr:methylmalonyl Co-A mutase-associated GTPase MeaB [Chitinophagaceae bacterium]
MISLVENNEIGSNELLRQLNANPNTKIIGITGPPGAGKSTLVNALLKIGVEKKIRIAVLSIDPSSPFNFGALLGDRIRMSEFYNHPDVYIRSLASRGSLGGLNKRIIEIVDVLKASNFDYIFIETVGVGQSEVEIAGLADTTIVVLVPEAGDEVQSMKAGLMEIADIFIVNKSDRPNANEFATNLKILAHQKINDWEIPVLKTVAHQFEGVQEVFEKINEHAVFASKNKSKKLQLLTQKTIQLIQEKRMQDISSTAILEKLKNEMENENFNIYEFVKNY